jgi:hypothetical protein
MEDRLYKRTLVDGSIRWDATVYTTDPITGKRRQVRKTFMTQEEAMSWLAQHRVAVANNDGGSD